MLTKAEKIKKLNEARNSTLKKDEGFVMSLSSQFRNKGDLSVKQWEWVDKLLAKIEDVQTSLFEPQEVPQTNKNVGDLNALNELFARARAKDIKRPKIRYELNGTKIRLAWSSDRIYVNFKLHGETAGNPWEVWETFGYIDKNGDFIERRDKRKYQPEGLVDSLKELMENPSSFGKAYGQRLKYCIFCNAELTSLDSLYYGYGPICAEKWGLEWGDAKSHLMEEKILEFAAVEVKDIDVG